MENRLLVPAKRLQGRPKALGHRKSTELSGAFSMVDLSSPFCISILMIGSSYASDFRLLIIRGLIARHSPISFKPARTSTWYRWMIARLKSESIRVCVSLFACSGRSASRHRFARMSLSCSACGMLMNPPFFGGDKHLLKAIKMQRRGGRARARVKHAADPVEINS